MMFIGRDKELERLNQLYDSKNFEFLILYGRRRIGKSELLKEFAHRRSCLFFSSEESDNNLSRFGKAVLAYFNYDKGLSFASWDDAFSFIAKHSKEKGKTVIIIDEFPYIAKAEPKVKSILQNAIDNEFKDKNILLILCGSSVSFMLNDVMGRNAPLYGRNTAVMEVLPFTYDEIRPFLPSYSNEDLMKVYSILGGVPYYLSKFKDKVSLDRNIADQICALSSPLREEPITLLKSELREVNVYNDILQAIALGSSKVSEIASKAHVEVNKISMYLEVLKELRIIEKITCCGEKERSKKTQYLISDNFFAFWYRFIFTCKTEIDMYDDPINYVRSIKQNFDIFMGRAFEKICLQYLIKQAKKNKLPFIPQMIGKWWGTNILLKEQTDIDILAIRQDNYLFCECKFRNTAFNIKDFHDLISLSSTFKGAKNKYYYFFVKSKFDKEVIDESKNYDCKLITIDQMF